MSETTESELRGHLRFALALTRNPWRFAAGRFKCPECGSERDVGDGDLLRLDQHGVCCPWRLAMEASVEPERESAVVPELPSVPYPLPPEDHAPDVGEKVEEPEEIIEIDEDGVVHALGDTAQPAALDLAGIKVRRREALKGKAAYDADYVSYHFLEYDVPALIAELERLEKCLELIRGAIA